jgi:hypothetical protein
MRLVVVAVVVACSIAVVGSAQAASPAGVNTVARPAFPPALADLPPRSSQRLQLVSTTPRDPALFGSTSFLIRTDLPLMLQGVEAHHALPQPGMTLVVYGTGLIAGFGQQGGMRYAFDLRSFGFPPKSLVPNAYGPQEIVWARQLGRLLVVQTNHLGYASHSGGRNGYLTAIDLDTGKVRWRSPSLVANAGNFLVVKGMVVSGYGFTAEKDWLYLLDAKTGRVRHRLALPSMAEQLMRRGDRIVVRCYDAKVVVRLA